MTDFVQQHFDDAMSSLIRFTRGSDLRRLQDEFDRLFDGFLPKNLTESDDAETAVWTPRVDLAESDDAYLIHVDVPGMTKDDLNINFHDGVLTISGERKFEDRTEKENFVRVERRFGHFYRSFNIPKAVQSDSVHASYDNGVLVVRLPKAEESKPRKIAVK